MIKDEEETTTNSTPPPSREELLACLATLQNLVANNRQGFELLEKNEQIDLIKAAGIFSKPSKDDLFKRKKQARKKNTSDRLARNNRAREKTGIRVARTKEVFVAPLPIPQLLEDINANVDTNGNTQNEKEGEENELTSYRNCYVCKAKYTKLHFFYDTMCQSCADLNYQKRFQTADLSGQVALMTGSRLKIGYHVTLMLLRAGATVIATTRFPADSAIRYAKEEDYSQWCNRLHIHGLDLRHTPSVELFCTYIEQTYDRLDILINNAAQTVRRPPGFYAHMLEKEHLPFNQHTPEVQLLLTSHYKCLNRVAGGSSSDNLEGFNQDDSSALAVTWDAKGPGIGLRASAQLSQIPYSYDGALQNQEVFPEGKLDVDLQQVDLRTTNSWRLKLGEVSTMELLEVQLVNAVAPFVLCNRLAPMMKRDNTGCKHIVNVTAMEGKFYTFNKPTARHPHTNMAKAALNMLTHTSSGELAKYGIFMNAVDTGWVTDEDPVQLASAKVKTHDFQPPLDIVDGAARVCDPFFDGINRGEHWCGKFLKDYFPIPW
jgi:NAD(P)-dependent dehydrogenase (short-subunit alcohol dehydrogenase family)